jgi:hypothetical protein
MLNRIAKNIIAFALLLLFLIPTAEQTFHAILHASDVHCNTINEKHYHEQEHHCSFCDFNFVDIFSSPICFYNCIISSLNFEFSSFVITNFIELNILLQKVRGPPSALFI